MPPRKKARTGANTRISRNRTTTPASVQADTEADQNSEQHTDTSPVVGINMAKDPWTDDEETQLFKSIIQFKPTGVSAHFHMLSIQENLRSHGYTSGEHTKIPGIWEKLNTLYDLEALNEREDVEDGWDDSSANEDDEEDDKQGPYSEAVSFQESLDRVQDDFTDPAQPGFTRSLGDLMWERRFTDTKDRKDLIQDTEGDVSMDDLESENRKIPLSSPEAIDDLHTTRSGFGLTLPSREGADAAYAASVAEAEEEEEKATKKSRRGGKAARGRTRATRATPVQETDEDEEEESEDEDAEDESTNAGSPPAKGGRGATRSKVTKGRGRGRRK